MPGAVNRAFVHLLAVAWLLVAREANARDSDAEGRLRLEVTSLREAEPCGRAEELRARIAERLGRDPFDDDASARLRVTFDPSPRAWGAEVVLFDAHGERLGGRVLREEGGACEPLVASVVLTVAVLLEDLVPPSPTTPSTPVVVDTPSATLEETAPSPSPVE